MTRWFRFFFSVSFLLALLGTSLGAFDILNPNKNRKFSKEQPTTIAGVRGMDEPGDSGDTDARDEGAVEWLESQGVSESALKAFLAEGGLLP